MPDYQIQLNNKGINKRNVTFSHLMAAFLLIIMGGVAATIIRTLSETAAAITNSNIFYAVAAVYIISGLAILFITIKFNKKITTIKSFSTKLRLFEIIILAPILIYCLIKQWYVPAAWAGIGVIGILYAFYYENTSVKPAIVHITDKGVNLPNTKVGFLEWEKILRLIIRHQILTVEAIGNKLYQLDLEKNQNLPVSEIETYAMQRIKEEKKIIKNDW